MNLISKTDSQEYYRDYQRAMLFSNFNRPNFCHCGVIIDNENVVAAEVEKNIDGADVPTLEFFCSRQCGEQWLDEISSKEKATI